MSKNRILSLVLAMVMVLGAFGTVFAETATTEVNPNAAKIQWLQEKGYVLGDEGTNDLRLNETITRAEVSVIVTKALGLEEEAKASMNTVSIFDDVQNHWAKGYINILTGKNILNGDGNGKFRPDDKITNAEVITVMVMAIDGKAPAGVYPNNMIIRANELGLLEGLAIADYSADAIRNDAFVALYNMVMNNNTDQYQVLKGIVLENHRVSKLNEDQVTIEVLQEVKKADYVEKSRKEEGNQYTYTIPAELKESAEDLLGRVADFTVDKDGKVVKVKVDSTYEVIEGAIKAEERSISHDGYNYSVNLAERYDKADETIFRTYINNKAKNYKSILDEKTKEADIEYARVTVKNGKALFINGFNFNDIAPVKEVREKTNEVVVYNDLSNGSTKRFEVKKKDSVILVNNGKFSTGSFDKIEKRDVIHEFDGGFIVKKDALVSGEFKKTSTDKKDNVFVHIDDKEIAISTKHSKKPVYSFEKENDFYTLEAKDASAVLRDFRGEKVSALVDLGGKLQYIGSEIELGEFVAIATRVVGKEMRVLKADNKTYDYAATLDTKVVFLNGKNETTAHKNLNAIEAGSLVMVSIDGDKLVKVVVVNSDFEDIKAKGISTRELNTKKNDYRIFNDTVAFVEYADGKWEARSLSDIAKRADIKDGVSKANVLNTKAFWENSRRKDIMSGRSDEAKAILFKGLNITRETDKVIAKFLGFDDGQEKIVRLEYANGTKETKEFLRGESAPARLRGRDIVAFEQGKDDAKTMSNMSVIIRADQENVYELVKSSVDSMTVRDANGKEETYRIDRKAQIFGSLGSSNRVSIFLDPADPRYVSAVLVEDKDIKVTANLDPIGTVVEDMVEAAPIVEDEDTFEKDTLVVNKTVYVVNKNTVVFGTKGEILAIGADTTPYPVKENMKVRVEATADGVVRKITIISETLSGKDQLVLGEITDAEGIKALNDLDKLTRDMIVKLPKDAKEQTIKDLDLGGKTLTIVDNGNTINLENVTNGDVVVK